MHTSLLDRARTRSGETDVVNTTIERAVRADELGLQRPRTRPHHGRRETTCSPSSRPGYRAAGPLPSMNVLPTAVVFVLASGCAWRHLPPSFGVSVPTAHRRFMVRANAGAFETFHQAILDRLRAAGELDWSAATLNAASVLAKKGAH